MAEYQEDQKPLVKKQIENTKAIVQGNETVSNFYLYSIMTIMTMFGTLTIVISKKQDGLIVGPNGLKFNHPYFQCAIMFVGEFLCMFVYIAKLYFYPATTSGIQNPFKIGSPAIFDLISSSIGFVALNMVAASIVQMMGGLIVIINALLAYQLLGKKQYAHHWISLAFIVVGVSVVGYASQDGTGEGSNDSSLIGIFLLVIAMCFTGCQMVAEENLFSGQDLDPLFVVGCEGFIGLAVFSVILPIADKYECHNQLCHGGKLEDMHSVLAELRYSPELTNSMIVMIFLIAGYNAAGVMVTKFASSTARSTIDNSKTLVIWLIFLAMGDEKFIWLELAGFVLLVLGTLVYNEIIEIPIDFMNRNTAANIEKRFKDRQIEYESVLKLE